MLMMLQIRYMRMLCTTARASVGPGFRVDLTIAYVPREGMSGCRVACFVSKRE